MNMDLLMKLARLANENSNENEANTAARRVCLMLKESNYQLTNNAQPRVSIRRETYVNKDLWDDLFKYARTQQPFNKQQGAWESIIFCAKCQMSYNKGTSHTCVCPKCGIDLSKLSYHHCGL